MTTSLDVLDLCYAAVLGPGIVTAPPAYATMAQGRVYKPGDWPSQDGLYPLVKMRLVGEDRVPIGRSGPAEFTTTATIRITGEVSAPAQIDDGGATVAETLLWQLKRQIEVAIVNSYPLTSAIQQISSMRSQLAFNSEAATHLAGVQIDLALEFYEGPESFAPVVADTLDQVSLAATRFPPVGFGTDFAR
jgi:hypothetical protein